MDPPPVPKPRLGPTTSIQSESPKKPVPLPRTKVPPSSAERVTTSDIFHSIGSVSKQFTGDVAQKVQNSAKTVNERLEKSISDGSKFAKGTFEKTITTSRAMRDSVTKSVIEGTKTAGRRLRRSRKSPEDTGDGERCVSMPAVDVSLFDNIQFHSPLLEQRRHNNDGYELLHQTPQEIPSRNSNYSHFDDLSLFSSNSDSNIDTVSNFSHDSRENDQNITSLALENEQLTYDTPKASRANSVVGVPVTPEIPDRRKRLDSHFDFMRQNSLYENWNLPGEPLLSSPELNPRPSKSTIYEFDPLNTNSSGPKYEGVSNELLLLESFLTGDTYGTISGTDTSEENFDFVESDYFNPPTPPERSDSLFPTDTECKPVSSETNKDNNSNWYTEEDSKPIVDDTSKPSNSSVMQKFSHMLKLDTMLNKSAKQDSPKVDVVERPPINIFYVHYYSGMLTRIVSGPSGVEDLFKNCQTRYCVLSNQKLMCYLDPTNSVLKETYMLDCVNSIQIVLPLSSSTNNHYCFEMSMSSGLRSNPRKVVFGCSSASERRNWAQKIAGHLTTGFQPKYTAEFTRCGWCYMKEGVSGEWQGSWVMLIRRVLVYSAKDQPLKTVDLRKTRCVVTQEADEETKKTCPTDGSANLLLDCPHATLYLRFPHERELRGWRYMVKLAAHNNGAYIHHQQLTKEDIPTIVDKCISFIYAHGSMTEGIYRRAGSSSVLSELLGRFRRDSWSVQLSPSSHSEHDVAGVLKRFFRDLPEPLIPQQMHQQLIAVLAIKEENVRHNEYNQLMSSLPLVARHTARKLFAHLHFLHTMAHTNKMAADNLAAVWAPTIMPAAVTSNSLQTAWSSKEVYVVRELIANYEAVWRPTEAERRREAAVRRVLLRVESHTAPNTHKAAGDLKAWIHVKDRATCYQVELTPNKTCADICVELCQKAETDSHLLMLEEVICNETMRRIVHIDEIVLDVVLRWGYWDEEDRKDNYLIVKENRQLHEIDTLRNTTSLVCGELKFANEASKSFKMFMFEIKNGKLCYFKDKQGSHQMEEWNVKDIIWYEGHEAKRNPQTRWTITFIPRNKKQKRSKERPWFGCTMGGAVTEDQLRWMAAMMFAEYSAILPTPRLVIT